MERYLRKIRTFTKMGKLLVPLSTCKRLQVGAVIFPVDCSAIYAVGYNGPSRGLPNDSCTGIENQCGCVHAEANAVVKFNNDLAKPSILYSTRLPCVQCAGLILNCTSIIGVIWGKTYRSNAGYKLLIAGKLNVIEEGRLESSLVTLKCWKESC